MLLCFAEVPLLFCLFVFCCKQKHTLVTWCWSPLSFLAKITFLWLKVSSYQLLNDPFPHGVDDRSVACIFQEPQTGGCLSPQYSIIIQMKARPLPQKAFHCRWLFHLIFVSQVFIILLLYYMWLFCLSPHLLSDLSGYFQLVLVELYFRMWSVHVAHLHYM